MEAYYPPEQMKEWEALRQEVPTEEREAIEQGWTALLAEVRANRHLDPASPQAQALAERWDQLTEAVVRGFRGHEELLAAVGENYRQGRFADVEGTPDPEVFAFIARVHAARDGKGTGEAGAG